MALWVHGLITPVKFLNLVFIPGAKLDGHGVLGQGV